MHNFLTCGLVGLLVAGGQVRAEIVFPPVPRLATTPAELTALRAAPDFVTRSNSAVQRGEALLKQGVQVPEGPGDWVFYYANPANGQRLQPKSLTEHVDPSTGKVFTDERTIAAYRSVLHDQVNDTALALGWAYTFSGDDRFAADVKRLLLKLAADYDTYPARRDRWGRTGLFAPLGARRYAQSLDEAFGVIRLAKAYDLTRTAPVWSDEERQRVEERFFRLTSQTLLRFNQDINNHQTWYNAGLLCIASVLGDRELFDRVLHMRGGFYDQMERSIGADGLWYEGAMAYHNYALMALMEMADAARRVGVPLQEHPKFRAMFDSPRQYAYPNGQLPAINDSDRVDLNLLRGAFIWAANVYGEAGYTNVAVQTQSVNLPATGLAILRRGAGADAVCAMVDYGPHGGGHGHFDKLNLLLYANGREWILDPGRLSYSVDEYKTWVKTTAAHNTVTIGGRNQAPTTGRLLWFVTNDVFAACATETDSAYPGVTLRRYLLLTDKLLADVFEVESQGGPVQVDWFAHATSDRLEPATGQPGTVGDRDGYQHFIEVLRITEPPARWTFHAGKSQLAVWIAPEPGETIFTARGIGHSLRDKVPCLIRRREAKSTRYVTVYDLTGTGGLVQGVRAEPFTIETATGPVRVAFTPTGVTYP